MKNTRDLRTLRSEAFWLWYDIAVSAMDGEAAGVCPCRVALGDGLPLSFCAGVVDFRQAAATEEGHVTDGSNADRDGDADQIVATLECVCANAIQATGQNNTG